MSLFLTIFCLVVTFALLPTLGIMAIGAFLTDWFWLASACFALLILAASFFIWQILTLLGVLA